MSWPDEVMEDWDPRDRFRFVLVKIAFDRRLEFGFDESPESIGEEVVRYTDAALAAMAIEPDENPETEQPDTGASAGQSLRLRLEDIIAREMTLYAEKPTTDPCVLNFRDGWLSALREVVRLIDAEAAMEKPDAGAENV